jgi:hypothetical protein
MVSLLSSGWDQVVPTCSGRQAVTVISQCLGCGTDEREAHTLIFVLFTLDLTLSFVRFFIRLSPRNSLGCYMVKSHGQLVLVSYVHYCTSTPSLSTLWSPTDL